MNNWGDCRAQAASRMSGELSECMVIIWVFKWGLKERLMSCDVIGAQWLQGPCFSTKSVPGCAKLTFDFPSRSRPQTEVAFSCVHSEDILSIVRFYKLTISSTQISLPHLLASSTYTTHTHTNIPPHDFCHLHWFFFHGTGW